MAAPAFVFGVLAGLTVTAHAESLLPLSSRLQLEHYGIATPPATSRFGRHHRRHRRMEALTPDNTEPIRILLDFDSLDQAKVQASVSPAKYSACFKVGDWYARGLPGVTPPEKGTPPTCTGTVSDSDCWGICDEDDLITASGADKLRQVVTRVAKEVEGMFALQRSDQPLIFDDSPGKYAGALVSKGYPSESACARDCTMLDGVVVADTYCTQGYNYDAVLSLVKPPVIKNVAGTGGACATDSTGRPTWLVFSWIQSIVNMPGTIDELVERHRPLVIHEILHALGFSNVQFRNARDASGNLKELLALKPVVDLDGAKDEVWYFTKGRAYELAQTYFGCDENGTWDGLPLMGLPDMGRASHWETRIMRDDVMSYGTFGTVSGITLAAMEDTGFYLANYSSAQCMAWGYKQGCAFVTTRCGAGADDLSAVVCEGENLCDACEGNPLWAPTQDDYLESKCAGGLNPCDGATRVLGEWKCNAQCAGAVRDGCNAAPTGALEGAGEGGLSKLVEEVTWEQFLFILAWLIGGILLITILRTCACPRQGSRRVLGVASALLAAGGFVTFIFNALALASIDTIPTLDLLGQQVEAFIGRYVMWGFLALGLVLFLIGCLTLVGICVSSPKLMLFVWCLWLLLLLLQVALSVTIVWWIYTLDDIPNEALSTLQGASSGKYDGLWGATAFRQVESFICNTYQKCCRDPVLDLAVPELGSGESEIASGSYAATVVANRTCVQKHEGTVSDVAIAFEDPSSAMFCPYVTGTDFRVAPPTGICNPLDAIYPLEDCRKNFCLLGAEGYFDFVLNVVAFIREYAMALGGLFSVLVLVQLILLFNLWNLRRRFLDRRSDMQPGLEMGYDGPGYHIQHTTTNPAERRRSSQKDKFGIPASAL